jgi:hypothetical protein
MNMTLKEARAIRAAILEAAPSLSDKTASTVPSLFPKMTYDENLIKAGTLINWNGIVKRAAVDLWDTEMNNPDNAPTLWASLDYRNGYRIIPEIITVATAFAKGEYGWWGEELYVSQADANVYTPDAYPVNWVKI